MLMYLEGTVAYRGEGYALVTRDGIGYKVLLPEGVQVSGDVSLYLHELVRDDTRELFGFFTLEALELFWKLIAISGVGPRGALKIVHSAPVRKARERITAGDLAFLTAVPGIGKKIAQKIILELKGVLAEEAQVPAGDAEALDALASLGYSRGQASDALARIPEGVEGTEDRIRAALKNLAQ